MASTIRAGWGRAEITPPLGSRLRGYFHERLAEGFHDPLLAKAVYLSDGQDELLFVALDLCTIDRAVVARGREQAAELLGIEPSRLILHATHTHLGPFSLEHVEFLIDRILLAAEYAKSTAAPVQAEAGRGHEESVAFCRRFLLKDGTVRTNPGRQNPEVVRPTDPIDPEVGVLRLTEPEQGRRLVIVNYALHLDTIGGKRMGADYPYFLERAVRRAHGPGVDCLFVQGCCGDVNHIDVGRADQAKGFAMAEEIGEVLAAEVLKVLARLKPIELTPLRFDRRVLQFEVPTPTEAELVEARAVREGTPSGLRSDLVGAIRTIALAEKGSPLAVEVAAATLGELAWVAVPGELFCAFGRRLKESSPAARTIIAELSHDDLRYIPTSDGSAAGGYESWNSLLPAEAGDRIVDTALELLAGQQG